MKRTVLALASMAAAILLVSGVASAFPRDLDVTFDGDGRVITDFATPEAPHSDWAVDVIIQPNGKIVAGGVAQTGSTSGLTDFALARYNRDGSLDPSFEGDGKVTTDVTGGGESIVALDLQSDGKIVAAGYSYYDGKLRLVRYNSDGSIDTSFGTDGKVTDDSFYYPKDMAIQRDDKIVVAGTEAIPFDYDRDGDDFNVARYNSDGSLDTSFSRDGKVSTDFGDPDDWEWYSSEYTRALDIQSDGKIVVVGEYDANDPEYGSDCAMARYKPDGSLDRSFAGDGKKTFSHGGYDDELTDVAIQPNGKIVAAPSDASTLFRFKADGSWDWTFDAYPPRYPGDEAEAEYGDARSYMDIAVQEDGKIVALNTLKFLNGPQKPTSWGVTRYNTDGSIDPSLQFNFGWGQHQNKRADALAMAVQPNGKLVLAGGLKDDNGHWDFALSRHMGAFPDTTKPKGSVTIDEGRAVTKDRIVTLTLKATDPKPHSSGVSWVRIRNAGSSWSKRIPYSTSMNWTLSRGIGEKTVYVRYVDLMGNVSETAKDKIVYRP